MECLRVRADGWHVKVSGFIGVCEREGERESVCERETERERESACVGW